ncbi:dihydrolipoamide acetyltransferase family protein [Kyrpidia spormannii]|uniref:Acetoin dehydrogenase E2 component (Dihydrolipoamide acetyltransferase) n=1 Tax=Kyrpidia spormannii TaxID=2055160 RepID=A0ACA8Z9U1_9BACL|nr:dihydrolipoamide acetyltransferase family protein [Kyrpidia spormannii]CAB3393121.1 acetoin dehydrogenase E2 component (dihydrolipoamide acetyltransferase) [Kyrpidia spormannii]
MAVEIVMPKLGMSMENGTVMQWHKHPGDPVEKGEPLVAVSSEKIEYEIEAPASGVLLEILVPEEGVVPCGTVIGYVGQPGERANTAMEGKLEAASASAAPGSELRREDRIKISPAARKMARSAGIDTSSLVGTGPGGRITVEDVQRAMADASLPSGIAGEMRALDVAGPDAARGTGKAGVTGTSAEPTMATGETTTAEATSGMGAFSGAEKASSHGPKWLPEDAGNISRVPLRGMRKVIAQRMQNSLLETAQLTLTARADVTQALRLLRELAQEWGEEKKPTMTDLVARAAIAALREHPEMNSRFVEGQVEIHSLIHLGIAVALDKGLVVPVIRDAGGMTFAQLSAAIRMLSRRARDHELDSAEMAGSTFTVTNLGQYGVEWFTPILNPPETGILGVGRAEDAPVYCGDVLERRTLLPLSLTFDHRVVDGAPAAQFLAMVKRGLEHPLDLLVG